MGGEGKKETTTKVGNTRYGLYNRAAGPGRPYSFCHSGTLWQNALLQLAGASEGTQGLGGTLAVGARSPTGTRTPCAGRDGIPRAEQRVAPITVTSQSPVVGTTHPVVARGASWDAQPA